MNATRTQKPLNNYNKANGNIEIKSHTFRVDSCSKHLLAAPLIVQNVDAWKSDGN